MLAKIFFAKLIKFNCNEKELPLVCVYFYKFHLYLQNNLSKSDRLQPFQAKNHAIHPAP